MQPNKEAIEFLQKQEHVTLGFSTGKDSVACAAVLREIGVPFTPFFFFHVPDLEFVERNVRMYEDIFDMRVVRLPHPMLYDYLRHQDFQPPDMMEYLHMVNMPKMTFEDLIWAHFDAIGQPEADWYDVVGMRASESLNRRLFFRRTGTIAHKKRKVYPIADWTEKETYAYLKAKGIPLTPDYKIWDRSFDGLKYQFMFGVKENYPEDWQRILELFPLAELELFRYKTNTKYFPAQ